MFLSPTLLVVALSALLSESSASILPLSKRWDTTLCTADTSGVPIPDADNFQLPLENLRQDMCWDLCVGDQATCTTKTKVCYDFHGPNLIFTYNAISGYTYTKADIWLGLSAPASTTPTSQYTTSNGFCTISADQTTVSCNIPYDTIVPGDALLDVLAEMCPNGDREGYVFYLYTNAQLTGASGAVSATDGSPAPTTQPARPTTPTHTGCSPTAEPSAHTHPLPHRRRRQSSTAPSARPLGTAPPRSLQP